MYTQWLFELVLAFKASTRRINKTSEQVVKFHSIAQNFEGKQKRVSVPLQNQTYSRHAYFCSSLSNTNWGWEFIGVCLSAWRFFPKCQEGIGFFWLCVCTLQWTETGIVFITDVSPYGVGAMLSQALPDGTETSIVHFPKMVVLYWAEVHTNWQRNTSCCYCQSQPISQLCL